MHDDVNKVMNAIRDQTTFEVSQTQFDDLKQNQPKQLNAIQEWRYKTVDKVLYNFDDEGN